MRVLKRDLTYQDFDELKIVHAIELAFKDVEGEIRPEATKRAKEIAAFIKNRDEDMSVETIQDLVEEKLMASKHKDVARSYIRYRYKHELARNDYKTLMDSVEEKLLANKVENQNANVDEKSFGGRIGEASRVVTKEYALKYCMSDMARENHLNNEIYIHDLDSYAVGEHNCLTVPFDKLLTEGFNTRQTDVRPAQSIGSAMQLVAVIFQLQSLQQFGGVSASHLDHTMVPYVRKSFYKHYRDGLAFIRKKKKMPKWLNDGLSIDYYKYKKDKRVYQYALSLTEKETQQGVESLYHNLKIWA